jgi:aspartate-semialdehyde dehydrogenase
VSYRVGVLGATGAVGSTMLEVLGERDFPVSELVPLASERSAGKRVGFGDEEVEVQLLTDEAIQGLDLVLSSAGGSVSAEWAPRIVHAGAVVVDNTSYWRLDPEVPLVIPEVNADAVAAPRGIVANPNCTAMAMVTAIAPIHRAAGIERIIVSTYQSVSGTGRRAIAELNEQSRAVLAGEQPSAEVYPHQIAFNVIPQVETFKDGDDYTTEERKVMAETQKILDTLSPDECRALLAGAPGVLVVDAPAEGVYPLAIDAAGRDDVMVGRIRRDPSHDRCLNLWVVGDNLRKGAATNAVQIAELLHERSLVGVAT